MPDFELERSDMDLPVCHYVKENSSDAHHHSSIEIIYVVDGTTDITIDSEVHTLNSGQYCVIGCHVVHETAINVEGAFIAIIPLCAVPGLSGELMGNTLSQYIFTDNTSQTFLELIRMFHNSVDYYHDEFAGNRQRKEISICLSEAILRYIIGQTELISKNKRKTIFDINICRYVSENYRNNITLAKLSKQFGYSPEHFSGIIKAQVGMSLKDYIDTLRINEAKNLLAQGFSSEKIAQAVGYSCTRTYLRAFKKHVGITPGEFRKTNLMV